MTGDTNKFQRIFCSWLASSHVILSWNESVPLIWLELCRQSTVAITNEIEDKVTTIFCFYSVDYWKRLQTYLKKAFILLKVSNWLPTYLKLLLWFDGWKLRKADLGALTALLSSTGNRALTGVIHLLQHMKQRYLIRYKTDIGHLQVLQPWGRG